MACFLGNKRADIHAAAVCRPENIQHLLQQDLLRDQNASDQCFIRKQGLPKISYISKFRGMVKDEIVDSRRPHATFGSAVEPRPNPCCYLKKGSGTYKLPPLDRVMAKHFAKDHGDTHQKPRVPRATTKPPMGLCSGKNFIRENAKLAVCSKPREPAKVIVDKQTGEKYPMDTSGLLPHYILRKSFGKCPAYLKKRFENMDCLAKKEQDYLCCRLQRECANELSHEEQSAMVKRLQDTWMDLKYRYDRLPLVLSTMTQVKTKLFLEEQMQKIEQDVDRLEKSSRVLVANS